MQIELTKESKDLLLELVSIGIQYHKNLIINAAEDCNVTKIMELAKKVDHIEQLRDYIQRIK